MGWIADLPARRRRVIAAVVVLATFGAGIAVGRVTNEASKNTREARVIGVGAADNGEGAVRASTRRLRISVGLSGWCVGDDATVDKLVQTRMRETPTAVRLVVTLRRGAPPSGICAGVGGGTATSEVTLDRPLGQRRIVNLAGAARIDRGAPRVAADASRSVVLFVQSPVLAVAPDRRSIRVVVRTRNAVPPGLRLQLDAGRALAKLSTRDARRRCFAATIATDGDPERAPHLLDPHVGHHPRVSLVQRDGTAVGSRPGEISSRRRAAALITAPTVVGGLGCR